MKKTALVGVALVSAGAIALYSQRGGKDAEPADSSDYTVDRIWIDHIPRSERDTIQIFLAITEQPFGVFQATSQWKGQFELFRYEKHGDELRVYYGQSGEREKIKAKSVKCDEKGFDYCLE